MSNIEFSDYFWPTGSSCGPKQVPNSARKAKILKKHRLCWAFRAVFKGLNWPGRMVATLVLEHHQVDGLNGRSVGLHNKLDLDPGLTKGRF